VKGKVQETAGKITKNPSLEAEGKAEKNTGKVEEEVGQIAKSVREGNKAASAPDIFAGLQ
jgi:uncharacterized protein YjbJ (UPF0337 family)